MQLRFEGKFERIETGLYAVESTSMVIIIGGLDKYIQEQSVDRCDITSQDCATATQVDQFYPYETEKEKLFLFIF